MWNRFKYTQREQGHVYEDVCFSCCVRKFQSLSAYRRPTPWDSAVTPFLVCAQLMHLSMVPGWPLCCRLVVVYNPVCTWTVLTCGVLLGWQTSRNLQVDERLAIKYSRTCLRVSISERGPRKSWVWCILFRKRRSVAFPNGVFHSCAMGKGSGRWESSHRAVVDVVGLT